MTEAFMDESWMTRTPDGRYLLVVAAVFTTHRRSLELMVKRLKRAPKLKAHSEIKASVTPPALIAKFLQGLAQNEQLSIAAALWRGPQQIIEDYEDLYQRVVARCAWAIVKEYPRVDLILDKRYTNVEQQLALEGTIREAIAGVPRNIVRISQVDSQTTKALTAPDFVSWAFAQHYGMGNSMFYNLLRAKITHFDDLSPK